MKSDTESWKPATRNPGANNKRAPPGRPRKDEEPLWLTYYQLLPTIGDPDRERLRAEHQRRSAFVLITNLAADAFPAERLLQECKAQTSLEQRFHFIHDPVFVDAFFVHKPEPVEASGYVLLMACLVFSLLERRVRRAGRPLDTPSRGELLNPTGFEVLHHIQGALVVPLDRHHRELFVQPSFRKPPFHAILQMAGFGDRIYTEAPPRPG